MANTASRMRVNSGSEFTLRASPCDRNWRESGTSSQTCEMRPRLGLITISRVARSSASSIEWAVKSAAPTHHRRDAEGAEEAQRKCGDKKEGECS